MSLSRNNCLLRSWFASLNLKLASASATAAANFESSSFTSRSPWFTCCPSVIKIFSTVPSVSDLISTISLAATVPTRESVSETAWALASITTACTVNPPDALPAAPGADCFWQPVPTTAAASNAGRQKRFVKSGQFMINRPGRWSRRGTVGTPAHAVKFQFRKGVPRGRTSAAPTHLFQEVALALSGGAHISCLVPPRDDDKENYRRPWQA